MMKKLSIILALAFIGFTSFKADEALRTKDGAKEEMPSIVLKDINGKDVDLKILTKNGKLTVISFWATWCSPCKKELDNINLVLDEWKEKYNMQLVAISIDDSRNAMKVKPFVEGKKWDFPVLLDINQDTKRSLNFQNVPYTLLVDREGNIIYKHSGYVVGDEQVLEAYIEQAQ